MASDPVEEVTKFFGMLHCNRHDEEHLHSVLSAVDAPTLNRILTEHMDGTVCVGLMKRVTDRVFGPDWKTGFLKLLGTTRVADLTLESKIALLSAIQLHHSRDAAHSTASTAICGVEVGIEQGEV